MVLNWQMNRVTNEQRRLYRTMRRRGFEPHEAHLLVAGFGLGLGVPFKVHRIVDGVARDEHI